MFSVAPVLSPALKELLHAQLPLLQLFMDPFSQLVVLPTSEGQDPFPTGPFPLGPLCSGAGQQDNRDTSQSWGIKGLKVPK